MTCCLSFPHSNRVHIPPPPFLFSSAQLSFSFSSFSSIEELLDPEAKKPIAWTAIQIGHVAIIQASPAICHRIASGHFAYLHLFGAHPITTNTREGTRIGEISKRKRTGVKKQKESMGGVLVSSLLSIKYMPCNWGSSSTGFNSPFCQLDALIMRRS